ncbi:MAG: DegV family protein [Christensenellales bacterium]|jgi:DegV family protein with EDD domain
MAYEFEIVTDSSCDFSGEWLKKLNLHMVPLEVEMEGRRFPNDADWPHMSRSDFYNALREGKRAKTSAPSSESFAAAMRPYLEAGRDVLVVTISSALSGSFNAASVAVQDMREQFPERTIECIDSLSASLGMGMLLYYMNEQRLLGRTALEVKEYAEKLIFKQCHWFTVDDLMFLKRGGRVSATSAMLGTLLNIKPVMHMDDLGRLTYVEKARGRKASLRALMEKMKESAAEPFGERLVFISQGDCMEDAQFLADLVRENCGARDVMIGDVRPVIGAHSGPGTVALFFIGKQR